MPVGITLGPAVIVRGKTGQFGGGIFSFGANDKIVSQGLIWADAADGTITVRASAFTNAGILRASDGGTLKITSSQFADTGTREESSGGKILVGP